MNNLFVLQNFGLGDVIFCQSLVRRINPGWRNIYWPVLEHYYHDLARAYPDIYWIKGEGMHGLAPTTKNEILKSQVVPIKWSDTFQSIPYEQVMAGKYAMYGMDWNGWKKDAMWQRDSGNEDSLFEIHGIKPGDKYSLISMTYGSEFQHAGTIETPKYKSIFIKRIPGFSLFDWAKLMEHATEIHFVASSNIYLLELLSLQAEAICIYPRGNGHHRQYDYLLRSHEYILK